MKRSIVSPGFVKRTLAKLLKLDQQLGIVVDGNVASKAIAVGKYVNLINSTITGKPDGIYVATGAVSSGGTVTAADISGNEVSDGVTNELSEQIGTLNSKLTPVVLTGLTTSSTGAVSLGITSVDHYITTPFVTNMFDAYCDVFGYAGNITIRVLSRIDNTPIANTSVNIRFLKIDL